MYIVIVYRSTFVLDQVAGSSVKSVVDDSVRTPLVAWSHRVSTRWEECVIPEVDDGHELTGIRRSDLFSLSIHFE
jgi:hypothetical protein